MTIIDSHGLQWRKGAATDDNHLGWQGHERVIVEVGKALLPPGGTFLDVGAHVGLWTLNLGLKAGSVYSIEANPETYKRLIDHIDLNEGRCHGTLFFPYQFAAWDCFEELALHDPNGREAGGSTRCVPGGKAVQGAPIDIDIDHVRPDLVKIDVEGAEHRVLRGMKKITDKARPTFIIELHDHLYGPECREETIAFLNEHEYRWDDGLRYHDARYIVAHPVERKEQFDVEVVKAGENPLFTEDGEESVRAVRSAENFLKEHTQ